jgi:ribosomal protein S27E
LKFYFKLSFLRPDTLEIGHYLKVKCPDHGNVNSVYLIQFYKIMFVKYMY